MVVIKRFCRGCGLNKPLDAEHFYADKKDKAGRARNCKDCAKAIARKHYQNTKVKTPSYKSQAISLMGSKCQACGFDDIEKLFFECQVPPKKGKLRRTLGPRKVDWSAILDNATSFERYYKLICFNCSTKQPSTP